VPKAQNKCLFVAEDNLDDEILLRRVLRELDPQAKVTLAHDGEQALTMLNDGVKPDLIILDMNMPKMDGLTVLKAVREDDELNMVPVVVFSSSEAEKQQCLDGGATFFVQKPIDIDEYKRAVKFIVDEMVVSTLLHEVSKFASEFGYKEVSGRLPLFGGIYGFLGNMSLFKKLY
jgi:CheY-like chemotaxis protein